MAWDTLERVKGSGTKEGGGEKLNKFTSRTEVEEKLLENRSERKGGFAWFE